jgi:cytochrome oxidase complex assembly protein 1
LSPEYAAPVGTRSRNLVLILVIAGLAVGGFLFVRYQQTVEQPMALARDAARRSSEVREAMGEPLRFGRIPEAKVRGKNAHLGVRVRGPRGSGVLLEWAQMDAGKWQLCSLLFRDESTTTDVILVSRLATHCARE